MQVKNVYEFHGILKRLYPLQQIVINNRPIIFKSIFVVSYDENGESDGSMFVLLPEEFDVEKVYRMINKSIVVVFKIHSIRDKNHIRIYAECLELRMDIPYRHILNQSVKYIKKKYRHPKLDKDGYIEAYNS